MNKIPGISESIQISQRKTINETDGDQFQRTLDKALEVKKASESQKLEASSLREVQPPLFTNIQATSTNVEYKAKELLGRLESYAKDLENPEKSLKDIEPLITGIKNDAIELLKEAEKFSAHDADATLKTIATECAVTANVEFLKFQRGDYV